MQTIDLFEFGVSFSLKQCRNFGIDAQNTLNWLLNEAGFRRFRLMSYWDEHEKSPGELDFTELDWQIQAVEAAGGVVSLCLGARQPRWPENHWPDWVWGATKADRSAALLNYVETVVNRYKDRQCIISWQLENEALLKAFGLRSEVDRNRLRQEFNLTKKLDPSRPVIMTTTTSWGIPIRKPIPDIVGFSYYQIVFDDQKQKYNLSFHRPWLDRWRAGLFKVIWRRASFIHELQLEPWGPKNIWEMDTAEQDKSMSTVQLAENLHQARATKLQPIDLWGGEWWYWRLTKQNDPTIWHYVQKNLI